MLKKMLFLFVIVLLSFQMIWAQSGKLAGYVTDKKTGDPLPGANVLIEGTSMGASSDITGKYVILDLPVGTYTVTVAYIGYKKVSVSGVEINSGLTTTLDFPLEVEAIKGEAVEVVAERPLVNPNVTNSSRIVRAEDVENLPVRGLDEIISLQTGAVVADGNLHVRGGRVGEVAYYVDGVLITNPYSLTTNSEVSSSAIEEMMYQSGGYSAEYGFANAGIINFSTKTGGIRNSIRGEFLTDAFLSTDGGEKSSKIYGYGYNLANFSIGGPLNKNIRYYLFGEYRTMKDRTPTFGSYPVVDYSEEVVYDTTQLTDDVDELIVLNIDQGPISFQADSGDYMVKPRIVPTYKNLRSLYGPKPNNGITALNSNGNVLMNFAPFKLKLGYNLYKATERLYIHDYSLLNTDNMPKRTTNSYSLYANLTHALGSNTFYKVSLSHFYEYRETGDHEWFDNISEYGRMHYSSNSIAVQTDTAGNSYYVFPEPVGRNRYLSSWGTEPRSVDSLAQFLGYGFVFDDYSRSISSYNGLRFDLVSQQGPHELKLGAELRLNTIRYYRIAQPMELASVISNALLDSTIDITDPEFVYKMYRNAYTYNIGYDITGEKEIDDEIDGPGKPIVSSLYLNDKVELKDLIMNLGLRWDYFAPNTKTYDDFQNVVIDTTGRIDRSQLSKDTKTYTYLSPRLGFSFPVTDRTVFHAQYGRFVQHPRLNDLYLSSTVMAAYLTQGNMIVAENPDLKPERTTQYEIGARQQLSPNVAFDITGYYKEVRDYVMMKNHPTGTLPINYAQFQNGDYGIVKGFTFGLTMRRTNGIAAQVSYTLQWAKGTGSDSETNFDIAWTGGQLPTTVNPLDFDQRHTGSVVVDYRTGSNANMLLRNFGINALFQFGSGIAYTPTTIKSVAFGRTWDTPTGAINSAYGPWTFNLDLRLDKLFKAGNSELKFYLEIQNVLNIQNATDVYLGTGEPDNDGWLESPEGQVWQRDNPQAAKYYKPRIADPRNFGKPRQVRFGVTVNL